MEQKRNKRAIRSLLTMVLAVVMCTGLIVPTFAAGNAIEGTEGTPAQTVVAKTLQMPAGTTTPTADFEFVFTKVSVDGDGGQDALLTIPTISNKTISYTSADAGTIAGDVKTVTKDTASLFTGVTFPHAGVYVYTVEETGNTYTITDQNRESMTYSEAKYQITVYVKNGASNLYVSAIAVVVDAEDNATQTIGDKVAKLQFTNTYLKSTGGVDPTNTANHTLAISKEVVGDFGDRSKYFTYEITAIAPTLVTVPTTYKAYVLDASNAVVTSTDNAAAGNIDTDAAGKAFIKMTAGTQESIKLKHGQKLVFSDLHVGASYIANEKAVADYVPSIRVTENGVASDIPNPTPNIDFTTGSKVIGESANSAAFTNTYQEISITGLSLDNLPLVVILVMAAGAFVAFIIVKSHKNHKAS